MSVFPTRRVVEEEKALIQNDKIWSREWENGILALKMRGMKINYPALEHVNRRQPWI